MASEDKFTKQLMTCIVQALIDSGHAEEAKRLAEVTSTQDFDSICKEYCIDAGPVGTAIEQVMFLFYDWNDEGDDDAAVMQFKEKYGMHPAQSLATARFYWGYISSVSAEWKRIFPELYTRFASDDVRRIPWGLKLMYSASLNVVAYAPVPEYGMPLRAIVRQKRATGHSKAIVDHIPEGMTIKEYDAKKASMKSMDLFGKKPDKDQSETDA